MGRIFITTQRGYPLGNVVSALQKEIRRGKEREAMYWAMEMLPKFEQYLWRRLLTIVHEDIGGANPQLLVQVPAIRTAYFDFRSWDKDGSARLALANCLSLMARSPKSRAADHLQCCVMDEYAANGESGQKPEIPDYAIDKHTARGKSRGRGFRHWLTVGCELFPPAAPEFELYRSEAEEIWIRGVRRVEWDGRKTLAKKDNHGTNLELFEEDEEWFKMKPL